MALMVAEDPSPTPASRGPHAAAYEATRQATGPPREQASSTLGAKLELKWTGVALLVIAVLLAVYLGADLLGELAAQTIFP
jgi:hypothetical protein